MPFQKKLLWVGASNLLIILILFFSGIFTPVEYKIYDLLFKLRGIQAPSQNIVIVSIDDKSMDSMNLKWPWDRKIFAEGIKKIASDSPKSIGLDFMFTESTTKESDEALFQALEEIKPVPVVCGVHLYQDITKEKNGKDSLYILETGERLPYFKQMKYGYINAYTDDDGFIRRTDLFRDYENKTYDIFTLAILKETYPEIYDFWKKQKPKQYLINYSGPDKTINRISFYQIYQDLVPKNYFKDKIVLFGPTFKDSQDFHPTPFLDYDGIKSTMAGVEIHANILNNLIQKNFYQEIPDFLNLLIILVLNGFVIFLFLLNLNFGRLLLFELLAIFFYYFFLLIQIFVFHTVLEGFLPAFTCLILFNLLYLIQQIHKNKEMQKEIGTLQSNDLYAMEAFCKKYDITKREKDIILLIINNHTKNQISKKLFISANTVKRHIYNIYKKTNSETREDLIKLIK